MRVTLFARIEEEMATIAAKERTEVRFASWESTGAHTHTESILNAEKWLYACDEHEWDDVFCDVFDALTTADCMVGDSALLWSHGQTNDDLNTLRAKCANKKRTQFNSSAISIANIYES